MPPYATIANVTWLLSDYSADNGATITTVFLVMSVTNTGGVTATNVAEAIETGPGNMPRMVPGALTKSQANDVVAYVTEDIEHPSSPGGLGLGGVGPVAEGFVGLFLGVGACMLIALWIGDRTEREDPDHPHEELEPSHV